MIRYIFGAPREGKSYVVTDKAFEELKNKKRMVLSNFPIVLEDGTSSRVWKPEFVYENIQNAYIIIDEAQRELDSQNHKTLDADEDAFFATTGHNNIDIDIISHNITRVTKAVRDRVNYWVFVQCFLRIPFLLNREGRFGRPFLFKLTYWITIEDMSSRSKDRVHLTEYVRFKKKVGNAYDTHFFRRKGKEFLPPLWTEEIQTLGGDLEEHKRRLEREKITVQKIVSYLRERCTWAAEKIKGWVKATSQITKLPAALGGFLKSMTSNTSQVLKMRWRGLKR